MMYGPLNCVLLYFLIDSGRMDIFFWTEVVGPPWSTQHAWSTLFLKGDAWCMRGFVHRTGLYLTHPGTKHSLHAYMYQSFNRWMGNWLFPRLHFPPVILFFQLVKKSFTMTCYPLRLSSNCQRVLWEDHEPNISEKCTHLTELQHIFLPVYMISHG